MTQETWTAVDQYLTDRLVGPDAALDAALADSAAAGLPAINVSPPQGKLLHLLAKLHGARRILEVGTLGGYSTIWLARALPAGGRLVTLEYEPKHAEVARANLDRAGLSGVAEVRVGRAADTMAALAAEREAGGPGREPFDFVFVDADKPSNPEYFRWAIQLTRPGGLIVVDNVVRKGKVAEADNADPAIVGARRMFELIAAESRVTATAVQTVGGKGYDGFAVIRVND
jgi:predicted O-methyltransferase YrrM